MVITLSQEMKGDTLINKFMKNKDVHHGYADSWNKLMQVTEKIEGIIGHNIEIRNGCRIYYWYSTKKYVVFGNQEKWREKRAPFDCIGGKSYDITVSYPLKSAEKLRTETKKLAVWLACVKFITWYNKNVNGHTR